MQEAGLDTPHLRILAGQNWLFDRWELDRYFLQTLADLEVELPPNDAMLHQYVCLMAGCIIAGTTPPADGCRNIAGLWRYLDHTPGLRNWDILDDDLHMCGGWSSDGMNFAIIEDAKALLASSFCVGGSEVSTF